MSDSTPKPPLPPTDGGKIGRRAPPARSQRKAAPPSKIKDGLEQYIKLGAAGLSATGDIYSAEVWRQGATPFAEAWAEVAAQNEQVRRILSGLVEGGMWGAAVATSAALLAPVIAMRVPMSLPARMMLLNVPTMLHVVDKDKLEESIGEYMKAAQDMMQQAAKNGNGGS